MTRGGRRAASLGREDLGPLVLLVAVALSLRLPNVTSHGLYRDDAWPALGARTGLGQALRMGVTVPGFEVLVRAWVGVSRSTAWAQLPFVAASLAAVVLTYYVCRRLGCHRAAALAAAGVMALSPISVVVATRVKQYSFDALHTLLVLMAALAVARQPASPRRWAVLLGLATAVVVFSASLLPVTVCAIAFAASSACEEPARGGRPRSAVGIAGPAAYGAFVAVWTLVVLPSVPPPLHDSWDDNYIHHASAGRVARDTWHVLDQFAAGIFYRHGPTGPLILAFLAVVVLAFHRDVALLVLGPIAVALLLAAAERVPLGGGRIDGYLYPCVAVACGLTVERVVRAWSPAVRGLPLVELGLAAGIVVFAATAGRHHATTTRYPSADVGALAAAVRSHHQAGDGIVVSQFSRYPYAYYGSAPARLLFSRDYSTGFTVVSTEPDVFIMPAEYYEIGYDPDAAVRFAAGRERVWFLATDTPVSDTPARIQAHEYVAEDRMLAAGFKVVERLRAHGAHADLLVRREPEERAGPYAG